jgi:ABC-type multidrug transport system ATPase subunit
VAIKTLSLRIKQGEVFGLLGPNGAGKTSLISVMTGLLFASEGNAWIGGYEIETEINKVHEIIGVCPQFDLLWPDLTIQEHLYFYARLKGVTRKEEKPQVQKILKQVRLLEMRKKKVLELSGGMKRRLSIAIELRAELAFLVFLQKSSGILSESGHFHYFIKRRLFQGKK